MPHSRDCDTRARTSVISDKRRLLAVDLNRSAGEGASRREYRASLATSFAPLTALMDIRVYSELPGRRPVRCQESTRSIALGVQQAGVKG
jgi:hypothetical protein